MKWRKWNNRIHRDLGYLCFGLTIIYAVSGIAVNHARDWNPFYRVEVIRENIGPIITEARVLTEADIRRILDRLNLSGRYRSFRPDSNSLKIFLKDNTISVNLITGQTVREQVKRRFLFYEFNFLHLNRAKKWWTLVADIYAAALGITAITGLFVLRGKKGIAGRGAWLTGLGLAVPILSLWIYL